MIIGNGHIASAIENRKGFLFFASGVSDSSCNDYRQFEREVILLKQIYIPLSLTIVYFSSINIFDKDTPYYQHKMEMEARIRAYFKNYWIIRIGNIDWDTKPTIFYNYLREKKRKGEPFEIRDEWKYMLNKDTFRAVIAGLTPTGRNEICIFSEMKKVKDVI